MIKCKNCGRNNRDDAEFCYFCDLKLDNPNIRGSSSKNNYSNTSNNSSTSSSSFQNSSQTSSTSSTSSSSFQNSSQNNNDDFYNSIFKCCCGVFIVLICLFLIINIFNGIDTEPIPNSMKSIDLDGDNRLSFDEINTFYSNISSDDLQEIFDDYDKDKNSYITGREFTSFSLGIDAYFFDKENSNSYSYSSSSSSKYHYGEDGLCKWCGSDQISKSSDGLGNFECDVCGSYLYYADIFYIDDLKCPKCGGHVYSDNDGDTFKCKSCHKESDFNKLYF